jgi:hypothetical protein
VSRATVVWRWIGALIALLVGAIIGLTGAFVQTQRALVEAPWGTVSVPWGVPVVWIGLVAAIRGGAWAVGSRWGAWAVLVGWLSLTVALSAESPSGDLAVSGGGRQLVYLLGGVILGSAAATLPLPRPAAPEEPGAAEKRRT